MCITVLPKNGQNQCLLYLLFFWFAMFYDNNNNNNNNNNNIFACYEINFIWQCYCVFLQVFSVNSEKPKTVVLA